MLSHLIISYGRSHIAVGSPAFGPQPVFFATLSLDGNDQTEHRNATGTSQVRTWRTRVNSSGDPVIQKFAADWIPKSAMGSMHGVDLVSELLSHFENAEGNSSPRYLCLIEPIHREQSAPITVTCASSSLGSITASGITLSSYTSILRRSREKYLTDLFDSRLPYVSSICLLPVPLAALYAVGRFSGNVLDLGDSHSGIVTVHEGKVLRETYTDCCITGAELFQHACDFQFKKSQNRKRSGVSKEISPDVSVYFNTLHLQESGSTLRNTAPNIFSTTARLWGRLDSFRRLQDMLPFYLNRAREFWTVYESACSGSERHTIEQPSILSTPEILVTGGVVNAKPLLSRLRDELWARQVDIKISDIPDIDMTLLPYMGASIAMSHIFPASVSLGGNSRSHVASHLSSLFVSHCEFQEEGPSIVHSRFS